MRKSAFNLLELTDRLGNLIRVEMRHYGAAHRLQPIHLQALMYLKQANRYSNTPQALTEYLGLTKGTVSQSLLLLYRKGLVARYVDETDKRVVRLKLSATGKQLLKDMQLAPVWQSATSNVSPARIKTTVLVLMETLRNLQAMHGSKTFGVCNTCKHCIRESPRIFHCGLTGERLSVPETRQICRAHAPRE
jgi:DNA-binding MarR family transcriptional regulator